MSTLNKIDIQYKPIEITNDKVDVIAAPSNEEENAAIIDKLVEHLNLIKEYEDRIDAIDYLSANAAKLAGNPRYFTNDPKLINDIKAVGGSGNIVDFDLFQKAVDIVVSGFKNMALTSLTGANND